MKAGSVTRRDVLKTLSAAPFVAGRRLWAGAGRDRLERPNVLLLFSDQHHASAMGCAGHPTVRTPTMDALAARGVRFNRAYCQEWDLRRLENVDDDRPLSAHHRVPG